MTEVNSILMRAMAACLACTCLTVSPVFAQDAKPDVANAEAESFETEGVDESCKRFELKMKLAEAAYRRSLQRAATSYLRSLRITRAAAERNEQTEEAHRTKQEMVAVETAYMPRDQWTVAGKETEKVVKDDVFGKPEDDAGADGSKVESFKEFVEKMKRGGVFTPSDFAIFVRDEKLREAAGKRHGEYRENHRALKKIVQAKPIRLKYDLQRKWRTETRGNHYAKHESDDGIVVWVRYSSDGSPKLNAELDKYAAGDTVNISGYLNYFVIDSRGMEVIFYPSVRR